MKRVPINRISILLSLVLEVIFIINDKAFDYFTSIIPSWNSSTITSSDYPLLIFICIVSLSIIYVIIRLLILLVLKIILFFKNMITTQDKRIEITADIEWDKLEGIITDFNSDLKTGKHNIIYFIKNNYPNFNSDFLSHIDLNNIKSEFNNYLFNTISEKPIGNNIKSLNFGLFESDSDTILCYVSGCTLNPKEDVDWAVNPEYFPEKYLEISEFKVIYNELKKYKGNISDIEQLIVSGFMNLVIASSLKDIDSITNNEKLNLGSGYDSGDIFIIREN